MDNVNYFDDLKSDPELKLGHRLIVVDSRVSGYQSWLDSLDLSRANLSVSDDRRGT